MNSKDNTVKNIKTMRFNEYFTEVPNDVHNAVLNALKNIAGMEEPHGDVTAYKNKHFRHAAAIAAAVGVFAIVSVTGYAAYRQLTALQIQQFVKNLTTENVNEYLELDESSVQITSPDENGMYKFTWENGESYESLDSYDLQVGKLYVKGYGFNDTGLEYVKRLEYVKTITLNEDDTVTFAIYVPRQD